MRRAREPDQVELIHLELEALLDWHRRRNVPESSIAAAIGRAARGSAALVRLGEKFGPGGRSPGSLR